MKVGVKREDLKACLRRILILNTVLMLLIAAINFKRGRRSLKMSL